MNDKELRNRNLLLWNAFRDGSEKAFSTIYHEYVQDLYHYGLRFNSDSEQVKDSIQELFIKLYNNRMSLNSTDNIRLYLFKALKNRLIDIYYSRKPTVSLSDSDMPFEIANPDEPDTEDDWLMLVKKRKLKKCMEALTSRQREAIYLRFTKEMSLDEICVLLDLNNQSARNLIHRSIEKLRKEFLITIAIIISIVNIFSV